MVAATHDQLMPLSQRALEAGSHVLVEKPAALGTSQVDSLIQAAERAGGGSRSASTIAFTPPCATSPPRSTPAPTESSCICAGGTATAVGVGYDPEWRAQPQRSGGGELIDQGMHMIDLTHWLAGPLPLHSALLRTHFWDIPVEDNAALVLGKPRGRTEPWAMLHVTWTEWKNLFSIEVYCTTAKLGSMVSYAPTARRPFGSTV